MVRQNKTLIPVVTYIHCLPFNTFLCGPLVLPAFMHDLTGKLPTNGSHSALFSVFSEGNGKRDKVAQFLAIKIMLKVEIYILIS